ncbi:MAG: hypothetical protein V1798_04800 [Pseudomonadota bacterium]
MFLLDLVEALTKAHVSYAVAGGYAVALHGAVRGTVDVDLVVALTESDYVNCENALKSIGLRPKLPVSAQDVFRFRKEYMEERNLRAWSFYDPKDPARLVDIIITYGKRTIQVKTISLAGKKVPVLAKKELIRMKRLAGRPQDLEDVKALESIT